MQPRFVLRSSGRKGEYFVQNPFSQQPFKVASNSTAPVMINGQIYSHPQPIFPQAQTNQYTSDTSRRPHQQPAVNFARIDDDFAAVQKQADDTAERYMKEAREQRDKVVAEMEQLRYETGLRKKFTTAPAQNTTEIKAPIDQQIQNIFQEKNESQPKQTYQVQNLFANLDSKTVQLPPERLSPDPPRFTEQPEFWREVQSDPVKIKPEFDQQRFASQKYEIPQQPARYDYEALQKLYQSRQQTQPNAQFAQLNPQQTAADIARPRDTPAYIQDLSRRFGEQMQRMTSLQSESDKISQKAHFASLLQQERMNFDQQEVQHQHQTVLLLAKIRELEQQLSTKPRTKEITPPLPQVEQNHDFVEAAEPSVQSPSSKSPTSHSNVPEQPEEQPESQSETETSEEQSDEVLPQDLLRVGQIPKLHTITASKTVDLPPDPLLVKMLDATQRSDDFDTVISQLNRSQRSVNQKSLMESMMARKPAEREQNVQFDNVVIEPSLIIDLERSLEVNNQSLKIELDEEPVQKPVQKKKVVRRKKVIGPIEAALTTQGDDAE